MFIGPQTSSIPMNFKFTLWQPDSRSAVNVLWPDRSGTEKVLWLLQLVRLKVWHVVCFDWYTLFCSPPSEYSMTILFLRRWTHRQGMFTFTATRYTICLSAPFCENYWESKQTHIGIWKLYLVRHWLKLKCDAYLIKVKKLVISNCLLC